MDDHLVSVFEGLKGQIYHMFRRWKLYRQLYAVNSHRIDLMNKSGGLLFVEFDSLTVDYMVLSLSKLTDPAGKGTRRNLSFAYMVEIIGSSGEENLAKELTDDLLNSENVFQPFRTLRNKRVAHNDLNNALGENDEILPGISRANIGEA